MRSRAQAPRGRRLGGHDRHGPGDRVAQRHPYPHRNQYDSISSGYDRNIPEASARFEANRRRGDYATIAASLGCHAETVTEPAALRPALERAISATSEGQPAVVDVITAETRKLCRLAPTSIG